MSLEILKNWNVFKDKPSRTSIKGAEERFNIDRVEILRSYRQNPTLEQISVLSELNDCSMDAIVDVLVDNNQIISDCRREGNVFFHFGLPKTQSVKALEYVKKRRAILEFRVLSCPEMQKMYFDEMEQLRGILDLCS